jgi:hypothetical protein
MSVTFQRIACPEDPFGAGAEVLPGEQPEDQSQTECSDVPAGPVSKVISQ